ncbi:MAG: hypothetical protein JST30_17065 [Armatimonadetes bacterium]|nr:hypothetical protein [Armatimonadota bacterium]
MRVENLTLKGNPHNTRIVDDVAVDDTRRFASFGIVFVSSQFVGHIVERLYLNFVDTAVGLLKGSGDNGEQTRLSRIYGTECRRGYYSNAPQAFEQELDGWNMALDETGVYLQFDRMGDRGVGLNAYNLHGTFKNVPIDQIVGRGTLIKLRRGTGALQIVGGRIEHLGRLFDYDCLNGQSFNNNMDVIVRGMEFTVATGDDRVLVKGFDNNDDGPTTEASGTQYGLFVDTCTFATGPTYGASGAGNLVFESLPGDRLRCVFEKCRFLAVGALVRQSFDCEFVRCYKSDFIAAYTNDSYMRQFSMEPSVPGNRMQSLRNAWQDTPWIQTGPRVNILRNADFVGLDYGPSALNLGGYGVTMPSPWVLEQADDKLFGFAKWGAYAGASNLPDLSPSPEAFFMALLDDTKLWQPFDEDGFQIDLSAPGLKLVTYQCLCRVSGTVKFSLVREVDGTIDTSTVFDQIVLTSVNSFSETTLMTLRAQVEAVEVLSDPGDPHPYLALLIEADEGAAQWQVFWQQAWGSTPTIAGDPPVVTGYIAEDGLRNTGFVRTDTNTAVRGDFAWGVNSLSIKAVGRLQIPNLNPDQTADQEVNVGWKNPYDENGDYDLADGELCWDEVQQGVVCRMANGWYMLHQPERVLPSLGASPHTWAVGDEKNIICTATSLPYTINLPTSLTDIVPGTVVRVFWKPSSNTIGTVTVDFGGTNDVLLTQHQGAEFVFYNDSGTGRWLVTQANVGTRS